MYHAMHAKYSLVKGGGIAVVGVRERAGEGDREGGVVLLKP